MSRTQWTLLGALVIQALLIALITPGSGRAAATQPRPLVPSLEATSPSKILISDAKDKSLTLVRGDGAWKLDEQDGYPADATKVDELLTELKELTVRRPVVSSGRYHETLKVTEKDHERRIRIWPADGDSPQVDLFVGSSPNYGINHVRVGGDDRVFEVRGLTPYDIRPEPGAWIKKEVVGLTPEEVTRIKLKNEHGEIELLKQDGVWTSAGGGANPDATKVDALVRSVCNLRITDPAGRADRPELGFDDPVATVEVERTDESETQVVTLALGAEVADSDGKRYLRVGGNPFGAILSKWDADKLVDQKPADLRQAT